MVFYWIRSSRAHSLWSYICGCGSSLQRSLQLPIWLSLLSTTQSWNFILRHLIQIYIVFLRITLGRMFYFCNILIVLEVAKSVRPLAKKESCQLWDTIAAALRYPSRSRHAQIECDVSGSMELLLNHFMIVLRQRERIASLSNSNSSMNNETALEKEASVNLRWLILWFFSQKNARQRFKKGTFELFSSVLHERISSECNEQTLNGAFTTDPSHWS